jgi:peptide/nickel transport system substrate-binding protein
VTHRDRAVVLVLVLVLVALGGVLALPRPEVAAQPDDSPAPEPELSAPPPVVLREGVVGVPASITPVTARSRAERALVGLVFSGLVRLGPGTTYQPDLASAWTSDETGGTWTFTIRDDAIWHDGAPVTADDVVYTVSALRSPEAAGAAAGAWSDVTAEVVDARTVRLAFGTPIGGVLALATQPLLPAHLLADVPLEDLAASEFARLPVGSGPFALTELDEARAVLVPASGVVAREPAEPAPTDEPLASGDSLATPLPASSPGLPHPYLDRLELWFHADEAALARALATGAIDAAAGLSPEALDALPAGAGNRLAYPTTTLSAVLLNLRPARAELRDAAVRTALLQALDRDALVADVLGGSATRADALIPPSSWAWDEASAGHVGHDPRAAAKALQKAGWKRTDGAWHAPDAKKPYRLELIGVPASANPRLAAVAAWAADAWRDFGFDVEVAAVRGPELATRLREGEFTAAVVDIGMGLEPDLFPLLATAQVRAMGSNLAGFQDPALDPLLEAARAPGTDEERTTAWKALLAALATRQPILPLAWNDETLVVDGVEGITPRLIAGTGDRYWDVLAWRLAADR